jgi:hypothetical protein
MKYLIIISILFTGCLGYDRYHSPDPLRNPFALFNANRPRYIYGVHPVNPDKCPPHSPGKKAYNYHSSELYKI